MAHLFGTTRGNLSQMVSWIALAHGQMWPWVVQNHVNIVRCFDCKAEMEYPMETPASLSGEIYKHCAKCWGKNLEIKQAGPIKNNGLVQGVLRPIWFWEYILPEEHIPEAMTAMGLINQDNSINTDYVGIRKAPLPIARKLLGAKPLKPEHLKFTPTERVMRIEGAGMDVIGWKPDNHKKYNWKNGEVTTQEGL